jgi:phosphatidylserine/phosphatidylglycerophosphate/cardiolipin synthase-like enzyme
MRRLAAVAVFMTLLLLPIAGASSLETAATPRLAEAAATGGEAIFNTPRPFGGKAANFRIVNRIKRAIVATPGKVKGREREAITIATYLMDHTPSVTALIDACRRGVKVRVLLDVGISNRNSRRLIRTLNGDNVRDADHDGEPDSPATRGPCNRPLRNLQQGAAPGVPDDGKMTLKETFASVDAQLDDPVTWGKDGSYVKRCNPSCRTNEGNMHTKMFLFSRTAAASNVVMVSSSNLNRGGAQLGWNDMYVIKGRPRTYGEYVRVHRLMTNGTPAPTNVIQFIDGPYTSRFFPIRNAGRNKDPVLKDLNKIRCHSSIGATRINISMFFWKGARGNYITDKLFSLARHGCRVKIIYGAPSRDMADRLRDAARRGLVSVYDSRWDFNDDGFNEVRTHCKYVLVRGSYEGKVKSVVMTGSPNWVHGSLSKGDELTLNIELKSAYNAYLNNWQTLRKHSRKVPYN